MLQYGPPAIHQNEPLSARSHYALWHVAALDVLKAVQVRGWPQITQEQAGNRERTAHH